MAFPVVRVCVTVVDLNRAVSCAPGSAVIVVIYACAITRGRSFTLLSVWGFLISFWSVLISVFFHSPVPFIIIILLSLLSLLLFLLLVITVIIISLELPALCDRCLGWDWVWRVGLVVVLRVCQAFGVLLLPGFGVGSSNPQVPGTQPPCSKQALTDYYM